MPAIQTHARCCNVRSTLLEISHSARYHGSCHQREPTGFIIGPWTDNCRTHVNAKNVITPSNSINQIYVKFITCLPTKLNCLIPGVRGYFRSFESNETAELLLLSDKIHIESLRWAVKQIWRPNLGHYLITILKLAQHFVWNFSTVRSHESYCHD